MTNFRTDMSETNISAQIKKRITEGGTGKLYVISDFKEYLNDLLVAQVLSRLERSGFLIRITQGIYLYPEMTRFGVVYPSLHDIATTIAKRDNATIIPSGPTASNQLGLSTQVPMKAEYLTSGSPRVVKVDKRTINFKKCAPQYFLYKSQLMPLIVLSFKDFGKKNIDNEVLTRIREILHISPEKELVKEDLALAPLWIKQILIPIFKEI